MSAIAQIFPPPFIGVDQVFFYRLSKRRKWQLRIQAGWALFSASFSPLRGRTNPGESTKLHELRACVRTGELAGARSIGYAAEEEVIMGGELVTFHRLKKLHNLSLAGNLMARVKDQVQVGSHLT